MGCSLRGCFLLLTWFVVFSAGHNVTDEPLAVKIIEVTCTPNKTITLTFDRGEPSPNSTDEYEVSMIEFGQLTILCDRSVSNITCPEGERVCICEYPATRYSAPADTDITFIVNVTNASDSVETREVFDLVDYIIPGPLMRVQATNVTSSEAHIKFCQDRLTARLYQFMYNRGNPLQYVIRAIKTQGVREELSVILEANSYRSCCKCMDIQLFNLTAFTKYDVIVYAIGGAGEGPKTLITFTTKSAVPSYPPPVDNFSFTRVHQSALMLMWQPLPLTAQGGAALNYSIEITSDSGFQMRLSNISRMYALVVDQELPEGPMTARIWAHNEAGRSQNYSEVIIPKHSDSPKPHMYVEFQRHKMYVLVDVKDLNSDKDQDLAFHLCKGHRDNQWKLDICQEYPKTKKYVITNDTGNILELELHVDEQLKDAENKNETVEENRLVKYYYIQWLDAALENPHTAMANVTIYSPGESIEPYDFDYYQDLTAGDDFYYYLEYDYDDDYGSSSRWKRDAPDVQHNQVPDARSLRSWTLPKDADDSNEEVIVQDVVGEERGASYQIETIPEENMSSKALPLPPDTKLQSSGIPMDRRLRVFMSVNNSSSIFPISCYFDRSKDFVSEPLMSLVEDSADKTHVNLTLQQVCDPDIPRQFMADFFEVSTSSDSECKDDVTFVGRVPNEIVLPSVLSVPRNVLYICVTVHRNATLDIPDFASKPFVKVMYSPAELITDGKS